MIEVYLDINKATKIKINNILNDYLDLYMDFFINLGPEEAFSPFFSHSIWLENKERCIQIMIELDAWTSDDFMHTLSPLHEYALYQLLRMAEERNEEAGLVTDKYYFESEDVSDDDYMLNNLQNIAIYYEILFQDHDFLNIPEYFEYYTLDPYNFENNANINLDDYVNLMPNDIKNKYNSIKERTSSKNITIKKHNRGINDVGDFLYHIDNIMDYFQHSITMRSAYKLLWNDNKIPRKENSAQQLLEIVVRSYCFTNNIDITPEAETGRGPVDFKFSYGHQFKAIAEVKLGTNNLIHGLEGQTVQYMLSEKVENAYFIVIILNEKELRKVNKVMEAAERIKEQHKLNIKPIIIDARLDKLSASRVLIDSSMK
ncbi:hypothetical protein [Paenibacillus rhizophilus]|uniref:Uncharacterized protein n=1 Tax=Paenibacillus rhizophilus TaxID=1850366 RepID=A0A3N9Q404_9BACL|nr:hypothetical protein [Paenibacillus rhizophilus]RQW12246.1 hypothetical protein EH198_07775 [Paenibacillus rhizophilus]